MSKWPYRRPLRLNRDLGRSTPSLLSTGLQLHRGSIALDALAPSPPRHNVCQGDFRTSELQKALWDQALTCNTHYCSLLLGPPTFQGHPSLNVDKACHGLHNPTIPGTRTRSFHATDTRDPKSNPFLKRSQAEMSAVG